MAKIKILVVEDEIITARNIQAKLKKLDYDIPAIASSTKCGPSASIKR